MRSRFAPSPTGPLHLGHAYSALLAYDMAMAAGGEFVLRIEDIDQSRARPKWEAQIYQDLHWLGLDWPRPVLRQSEHLPRYRAALQRLQEMGLLYHCICKRRDILAAVSAPQEGAEPAFGPDGLIYPGICRDRGYDQPEAPLRLNVRKACALLGPRRLSFTETGPGHGGIHPVSSTDLIENVGDIILARRGMGTSYHLSVVLDDAAQRISHVIRGEDLFEATKIHVLLQALLGLEVPIYHHHRLIRDPAGKRLAKRDNARAIARYRDEGKTPADIRAMVGM
ncbi:MAG: tRNA glutamyl-Q(34) synthetase GluQRS [Rhodobacterales bacterium]|nr:MAG: tRNA glutamyl-Q(34) synthetase GluQRS [Rhodobacterales bacterium]